MGLGCPCALWRRLGLCQDDFAVSREGCGEGAKDAGTVLGASAEEGHDVQIVPRPRLRAEAARHLGFGLPVAHVPFRLVVVEGHREVVEGRPPWPSAPSGAR